MSGYEIIDEPKEGPLAKLVVNPLIILLAAMIVHPLIGPVWLVLNSVFMRSPTFRRELRAWALGVVGLVAVWLLISVVIALLEPGLAEHGTPEHYGPYVRILFMAAWLSLMYWVVMIQSEPYELLQYLREHRE